jgi:hypothetical protein
VVSWESDQPANADVFRWYKGLSACYDAEFAKAQDSQLGGQYFLDVSVCPLSHVCYLLVAFLHPTYFFHSQNLPAACPSTNLTSTNTTSDTLCITNVLVPTCSSVASLQCAQLLKGCYGDYAYVFLSDTSVYNVGLHVISPVCIVDRVSAAVVFLCSCTR